MNLELKQDLSNKCINLPVTTNQFIRLCQQAPSVSRMILVVAKAYYFWVSRDYASDLVFSGINNKKKSNGFLEMKIKQITGLKYLECFSAG